MPYPLVWRWSAGWGRWLWNGPSVTRFCWPSLHAHIFSTSHPPRDVDLSNTERWALCFSWLCSVHKNAERLSSVPLRSMFCTYKRQTIELLLILLLILGYCSEVVCKTTCSYSQYWYRFRIGTCTICCTQPAGHDGLIGTLTGIISVDYIFVARWTKQSSLYLSTVRAAIAYTYTTPWSSYELNTYSSYPHCQALTTPRLD